VVFDCELLYLFYSNELLMLCQCDAYCFTHVILGSEVKPGLMMMLLLLMMMMMNVIVILLLTVMYCYSVKSFRHQSVAGSSSIEDSVLSLSFLAGLSTSFCVVVNPLYSASSLADIL